MQMLKKSNVETCPPKLHYQIKQATHCLPSLPSKTLPAPSLPAMTHKMHLSQLPQMPQRRNQSEGSPGRQAPHSTFPVGAQNRILHFLCGRFWNSCSWERSDSHLTAGSFFSKSPWHFCSYFVTRRFDFLCKLAGTSQKNHSALPSAFCACLWSGLRTHNSRIKTGLRRGKKKQTP